MYCSHFRDGVVKPASVEGKNRMGHSHRLLTAVLFGIGIAFTVTAHAEDTQAPSDRAATSVTRALDSAGHVQKSRRYNRVNHSQQDASSGVTPGVEPGATADLNRQSLAAAEAGKIPDFSAPERKPRTAERSTKSKSRVVRRYKSGKGRTVKVKKVKQV
jgi:hypothetical protein